MSIPHVNAVINYECHKYQVCISVSWASGHGNRDHEWPFLQAVAMVLTYLLCVCTLILNSALLCLSAVLLVFNQRCICVGGFKYCSWEEIKSWENTTTTSQNTKLMNVDRHYFGLHLVVSTLSVKKYWIWCCWEEDKVHFTDLKKKG